MESTSVMHQINELTSELDVQLSMEKRSSNAEHRLIENETEEKDEIDAVVVKQLKRLRSAMDAINAGRCMEVMSSISVRETSMVSTGVCAVTAAYCLHVEFHYCIR